MKIFFLAVVLIPFLLLLALAFLYLLVRFLHVVIRALEAEDDDSEEGGAA